MTVISLMTDYGIKDGTVGVMKGVIWGMCPTAQISDLSHMVQALNIHEAAYILERSVPSFPKGSIHLVAVDPGVGTKRRPMAAQIGDWFYVGPDNGVISGLLDRAEDSGWKTKFVELNRIRYWLPVISFVFHGRDIFSPIAAHLANGVPIGDLGTPLNDPVRIDLPKPFRTEHGWQGEAIYIDNFGNISTNIHAEHLDTALERKESITVKVLDIEIKGMVNTFGDRPAGEAIALMGISGALLISVVHGSAERALGIKLGEKIMVTY
ncbi:MAG: SAM-dependent chlorinase/fluorinase [Anaerolineae bacterium]|nr:SAM-dependent chlorinase/fluorinase [Anaerolineae bacterium]MBL8106950.1 SAM-dependent chlorinase/fluorinase [Anaerolineales bacterium]MCC7188051.1 SAM-dependent chlorinase/fluorinase [Anaerolineales bacterium]